MVKQHAMNRSLFFCCCLFWLNTKFRGQMLFLQDQRGNSPCRKSVRFWYIVANAGSKVPVKEEVKMKKFLVLVCAIAFLGGCSSAGGMNIISPSTPDDEVKEKVSKAPVTKIQAVSESELKDSRQEPPSQDKAETPMKTITAAASDTSGSGSVPSAGGMNIISPSTPDDELKEKISKAPVTKIQAVSESELKERRQEPTSQATKEMPLITGTAGGSDTSGAGSVPSMRSGQTLEALIILLEEKGTIQREELIQEIRKLEEKDRVK
ncbi:MAG: hypothetical protein H6Q92_850 [Nitrospirae bacterium]|nr:hypothetical protein [Nitrospirota bacterium]